MGIAIALGVPLEIAAGAVISGAVFGDKLSPLSDTTMLAPIDEEVVNFMTILSIYYIQQVVLLLFVF